MRLGTRLALTMLLGGLAVLAPRPASAYLWQVDTQEDLPVTSLQVSDVLLGSGVGVVKVQWDYTSLAGPSGEPTFDVERSSGGAWSSLGTTTNRFVLSNADWNTSYQYRVRVDFDESGPDAMLPPPEPCANPEDIYSAPTSSTASGAPST